MKALSAAMALFLLNGAMTEGSNCMDEFCENQLSDGFLLKYKVNVPADTTLEVCDGCTVSMEAIYDGEAWVSIGFSENGQMIGSEAVVGSTSDGAVLKWNLISKGNPAMEPMPEEKQTLTETSIEFVDGQTIMKFTKIMKEVDEIEITTGDNIFLYAYGSSAEYGYHKKREAFDLELLTPPEVVIKVGDEVCITNYIMDRFCIDLGHFLDDDTNMTLVNPEHHSFHCLLDVPQCKDSGYLVLAEKDEETGMHCLGYRLDDTDAVVEAGLAAGRKGYCTDCTGDDMKPTHGFRATVKGTVIDLGDGSNGVTGTPVLGEIEVLDASEECAKTIVNPVCMEPPVTEPPVTEPLPTPSDPNKDCTKEMCENQLSPDLLLKYQVNVPADTTLEVCDGCTVSMEAIYDGEAWVSIGFSLDGQMIGSEAVIGELSDNTVEKWNLISKGDPAVEPMSEEKQTLTDTSIEVVNGQTIMKFTKIMKEPGEIEISSGDNTFLWAHGSSPFLSIHSGRGPFELNLASGASEELTVPNKSAWLAHGIMAFLAWGVFVPFAVQASLLRDLLPQGPLWYKLHRALNATAFSFFVVIFAIGVAYTSKEGGTHFQNGHQKMGLAMFILAFFQVAGGVFRPHVPGAGEEKSLIRKGWEVGHRVLGVTLLACGFWQMCEGIQLYAIKYSLSESSERNLSIAYWVWIGVMSALIVVGGGFFKWKKFSQGD